MDTRPATPAAEFAFTPNFITGLLADQHPDLAHLPVQVMDEGWDNAMFRLGGQLAVRLPRRAAAAHLICHEQTWLPRLQPHLTLPVPAPLRLGSAARSYPWSWSVVPWLPGQPANQHKPHASQATVLGDFLRSLHRPAPADAPHNPLRGVPLLQRADAVDQRLERLAATTNYITPRVREVWQTGVNAPGDLPPTWLHGDLHPRNILVDRGIITGIIDWGDITSGDPATDLASIWMVFADSHAQHLALSAYGQVSDATLHRAKAWAVRFGLMLLDTGMTDHPTNAALGAAILHNIESPS